MLGGRIDCLQGVRVLDASRVLAGPLCGQVLGDLGADVIKVERPRAPDEAIGGDETRTWGPPFVPFHGSDAASAYFLSCNRNKRAITIDLGKPEGVGLFHELVKHSDVVLENFRAQSAARLGLAPAKLHEVNPRLVICSISGFGRTGPMSDLPGYDFAIQALSGLMSITGPVDGPPCKVGVAVTDVLTGLHAAIAVLACLRAREQSGHGYAIDLALLDCAVAAQVNVAQAYLATGKVPPRQGNSHLQIVPYQMFQTADSWLVLAVGNDGQWGRFCAAAGRSELTRDPRFHTNAHRVENRDALLPILEPILRGRTTAEWEKLLVEANVPHAPVWNYADLFAHPQAEARGLRLRVTDAQGREVDLVGSPFHIEGASPRDLLPPPALGEYTDSVLEEVLGLDRNRIRALHERGVI